MRGVIPLAYRLTTYKVAGAVIRIGRRSADTDRLLRAYGCRSATLVTAYNPFSRRMPAGWNRRMQARLARSAGRWPILRGEGSWRNWREAHVLVFTDPRRTVRLARIFRQNAVVIIRKGQPAALVSTS